MAERICSVESMGSICMINAEFWKGKNVFLTGHTGFKGAWYTMLLDSLGANVYGYSLAPDTDPNLYTLAKISTLVKGEVIGDILDKNLLNESLKEANPDIVVHFAAQAIVRESYKEPEDTFATNVLGTANLLGAIRELNKPCVCLLITTDKVYRNEEWQWGYREIDPLGGKDPYSASKACCELVIDSYRHSFFNLGDIDEHGVAIASARAGNVIGGGDWSKDRLLPDIANHFANGEVLKIRSPNAVRPWEHVLEPLRQYCVLIQKLSENKRKYSGAWNFGPLAEDAIPVSEICDKAVEIWGGDAQWELDSIEHPYEAGYLYLDTSKARLELGYQPKYTIDDALRMTLDWYKISSEGGQRVELIKSQIASIM